MKGKVYLVGAGPGDYKLLTLKGLECIKKADVIVYDRLANKNYLKEAKENCEFIYVGKASSDRGMLYDRWKNYADNLTGKIKELELVKKQKGEEYIKKYFQWSLLENFDESTDDSIILEREKYWKLVLNSKNQGLNDNY